MLSVRPDRRAAPDDLIARLLPDQPYARRVLVESPGFAVVPSLGPLTPGHSLLCPRAHVTSCARLDRAWHDEYAAVTARVRSRLAALYAAPVHLFEHGMASAGGRVLCSVDHAHVHLVPLPGEADLAVTHEPGWVAFDGSLTALAQLTCGREYIMYEGPEGVARVRTAPAGGFASQHMRRVIATHLGRATRWNWREAPEPLAADAAWRRFVHA
jgi:diadenosine tetraphosphate (Ap4A) HIT family hydrolase